jgi:hypothetical protein
MQLPDLHNFVEVVCTTQWAAGERPPSKFARKTCRLALPPVRVPRREHNSHVVPSSSCCTLQPPGSGS